MFKRIARTAVRHPWWVIGGWLVALAALVVLAPALWTNPERSALLPAQAEAIRDLVLGAADGSAADQDLATV